MNCAAKIISMLIVGAVMVMGSRNSRFYRSINTLTDESKTIMPGEVLNYQSGELALVSSEFINISKSGGKYCNDQGAYSPISQRTSCPWSFVRNVDQNRKPSVIYEAKCITETCLSSNMEGCLEQRCEEVKYFTWVKRKTGETINGGKKAAIYEKILEPISVGCTCACYMHTASFYRNRLRMCS